MLSKRKLTMHLLYLAILLLTYDLYGTGKMSESARCAIISIEDFAKYMESHEAYKSVNKELILKNLLYLKENVPDQYNNIAQRLINIRRLEYELVKGKNSINQKGDYEST